jgi:hypothetical protein
MRKAKPTDSAADCDDDRRPRSDAERTRGAAAAAVAELAPFYYCANRGIVFVAEQCPPPTQQHFHVLAQGRGFARTDLPYLELLPLHRRASTFDWEPYYCCLPVEGAATMSVRATSPRRPLALSRVPFVRPQPSTFDRFGRNPFS